VSTDQTQDYRERP